MRITTFTLAFLFLTTVIATPIYPTREDIDDAVAFTKRSQAKPISSRIGNERKITAARYPEQIICKQVGEREFLAALKKVDDRRKGFSAGKWGVVYPLTVEVGGCEAVVKIIKTRSMGPEFIRQEASHLKIVGQFIGWGRWNFSPGPELDYIIMPKMGIPLSDTPFKNDRTKVDELIDGARKKYEEEFHLVNTDRHDGNVVFRKDNSQFGWRAELIDWTFANRVDGDEMRQDPGPPFIIPARARVFTPPGTWDFESQHRK